MYHPFTKKMTGCYYFVELLVGLLIVILCEDFFTAGATKKHTETQKSCSLHFVLNENVGVTDPRRHVLNK